MGDDVKANCLHSQDRELVTKQTVRYERLVYLREGYKGVLLLIFQFPVHSKLKQKKVSLGLERWLSWLRHSLCKQEGLSFDLQHPPKSWAGYVCTCLKPQ